MTPSNPKAHYNSETPRPRLQSVWERVERIFYVVTPSLYCYALFFVFVCVLLQLCSYVCILTPSLTLSLIVIICVRPWETPNLWRFLTNGFDIRKTYVAPKFDLWITWGLSATLEQRRSPQHGIGIGRNTVKIAVSLGFSIFFFFIFLFSIF
jgi:hypothetical protein